MSVTSSPDVSQYEDLTIFDVDPSTLVERMQVNAQVLLPDWKPKAGNTELVLAEGLALIIAELVYAVNRLPGATTQTLLQLYGITRNLGTPATATVTVTVVGSGGVTIPAGTRIQVPAGTTPMVFTTDAAVTIAAGATSATLSITATQPASAPNGTPAGAKVTVLDQLWFVDSATLATAPAGGVDPETNQQWLNRGIGKLQGLSTTLVTASQFTNAALADATDGVFRATTVPNWDPTLNGGAGGTTQGAVTVAVLGQGNVPLTTTEKANVQTILEAGCVAGLGVHVIDPQVTTVPVTVTVWQQQGFTAAQVQANVTAALSAPTSEGGAGLTTDQWPWNAPVRLNDLITVITNAAGVAYVQSLVAPSADVSLGGVAALAEVGTVTVTVVGP